MDSRDSSEETEQLCDNTIDLMKSFQTMLLAAKVKRRPEAPPCPCGRANCQSQQTLEQQEQQPQQQQQKQTAICSNVSNLASSQGRVLTTPSEIRLLLRLESWLGDNGVLMVKPSVHQEEAIPEQACLSVANNNTAARPSNAAAPASSDTPDDGAGDFDEAAPDDCATAEEKEPPISSRRLLPKSSFSGAAASAPAAASGRPRHQHQAVVHRRERVLVKRPVSVTPGGAAAASSASAAGGSSGKSGTGARARTRDAELDRGGETMTLIRKLHRLLSVELRKSAAAATTPAE